MKTTTLKSASINKLCETQSLLSECINLFERDYLHVKHIVSDELNALKKAFKEVTATLNEIYEQED